MKIVIPPAKVPDLFRRLRKGAWPYWCFSEPPPTAVGDVLEFAAAGRVVAEAVVAIVDPPGTTTRREGHRHRGYWRVYWSPSSLLDLRRPMRLALLLAFSRILRRRATFRDWPGADTWKRVVLPPETDGPFEFFCPVDDAAHEADLDAAGGQGQLVAMDPHLFHQAGTRKKVRLWVGRCGICGQVYWTARPAPGA